MANDHAETFKKQMTCPACSGAPESYFANGYQCRACGRRESLFLKAFGVHEPTKQEEDEFAIHTLQLQLADIAERHAAHKANYEYMAKRCEEQQKEIESIKAQAANAVDEANEKISKLEVVIYETALWNNEMKDEITKLTEYHQQLIAKIEVLNVRLIERDDALHKLIDAADDSDGSGYGTLSTSFVRDIAKVGTGGTAPLGRKANDQS